MHELQAAHFREWAEEGEPGDSWRDRHEELSDEFDKLFDEEKEFYGDLPTECRRMFEAYLRRWRGDETRYKPAVLHTGEAAVEFVVEVSLKEWGISNPFKGRIDFLTEDLEYGGYWIRDAKWVRSIPGPDERVMSPQSLLYVWALWQLDYDVHGFIFDYGRTKVPTEPQLLVRGGVSVKKNMDTDIHTYCRALKKAHGKNWKRLAKTHYREKLEQIKAREPSWFDRERVAVDEDRVERALEEFTETVHEITRSDRSTVRSYMFNCKRQCAYHEPCVAEFQGLDIQGLLDKQFTVEEETYVETPSSLVD